MTSMSPDVNDPGHRSVSFDELVAAYLEAARGLLLGGVDLLLIETVFDTLNAKAAIYAAFTLFDETGITLPLALSGTITDASGRLLSGQTTEAFWNSIRHARPLFVGLNCALGGRQRRPYVEELAAAADTYLCAYSNAGLPNALGDYGAALEVARQQVASGAQIIDVNMDEGMLDSQAAMVRFLNLVAVEPDIARVPVMIDSSKWSVIEAGLKCVQGKPIVNSISLKEGEQAFIEHAGTLRRHGAAAVIMAFDEQGQADTVERRLSVCARAYRILTERGGFPPEDIIFDPNIFPIATRIEEYNGYGAAFIAGTPPIQRGPPP